MLVINSWDFRRKMSSQLKNVEKEGIVLVANQSDTKKSFLAIWPEYLFKIDTQGIIAKVVRDTIDTVRGASRLRYQKMRAKRVKNTL